MTKTVVVARAVLTRGEDKNREVFLGQRAPGEKFEGCWEHPGGKPVSGETLTETVKREVKEESNFNIKTSENPIATQIAYYKELDIQYVIIYFSGEVLNPQEFKHKEKDKNSKWEWFNKENLPKEDQMLNCKGTQHITFTAQTADHAFLTK